MAETEPVEIWSGENEELRYDLLCAEGPVFLEARRIFKGPTDYAAEISRFFADKKQWLVIREDRLVALKCKLGPTREHSDRLWDAEVFKDKIHFNGSWASGAVAKACKDHTPVFFMGIVLGSHPEDLPSGFYTVDGPLTPGVASQSPVNLWVATRTLPPPPESDDTEAPPAPHPAARSPAVRPGPYDRARAIRVALGSQVFDSVLEAVHYTALRSMKMTYRAPAPATFNIGELAHMADGQQNYTPDGFLLVRLFAQLAPLERVYVEIKPEPPSHEARVRMYALCKLYGEHVLCIAGEPDRGATPCKPKRMEMTLYVPSRPGGEPTEHPGLVWLPDRRESFCLCQPPADPVVADASQTTVARIYAMARRDVSRARAGGGAAAGSSGE